MIHQPAIPLWRPPSLRLPPLWRPSMPRRIRRPFAAIRDWLGFDLPHGADGRPVRRTDGIIATDCAAADCSNCDACSGTLTLTISGTGPTDGTFTLTRLVGYCSWGNNAAPAPLYVSGSPYVNCQPGLYSVGGVPNSTVHTPCDWLKYSSSRCPPGGSYTRNVSSDCVGTETAVVS